MTVTEGGCQVRDDGGGAASVLAVGRHCRGGGVRRGLPRGRPGLSLPTQEGVFHDMKTIYTENQQRNTITQETSLLLMKLEFSFRSWNINDDTGVYGDVCDRDR